MSPFIFMLLAITTVLASEDCEDISKACNVDLLPENPPQSYEELQRVCPILKSYLECTWSTTKKCHQDHLSEYPVRRHEAVKNLVNEVCDEDSELHKNIAENMECLVDAKKNNRLMPEPQCLMTAGKIFKDAMTRIGSDPNNEECEHEATTVACAIQKGGKVCGEGGKNAMVGIASRLTAMDESCPEGAIEALIVGVDLLDTLESITKIEDPLTNMVKRALK